MINWSRSIAEKIRIKEKNLIVYFDLLHQPYFQQISVLPASLKQKAIDRLNQLKKQVELFPSEIKDVNSLIQILKSSLQEDEQFHTLRQQLREHTKIFDQWRNENFFSVFPEFIGHL